MSEIYILHSLVILIEAEPSSNQIYKNEFYNLIRHDNSLPPDYSRDLLFEHRMHEEALLFLFYKKEFKELLLLVKKKFEEAGGDREQQKFWLLKFVKFCKKINDSVKDDFVVGYTDWVFKVDPDLALECLKRFGGAEPLRSEKVLLHIKNNGGPKACIKYLEYLAIDYGI